MHLASNQVSRREISLLLMGTFGACVLPLCTVSKAADQPVGSPPPIPSDTKLAPNPSDEPISRDVAARLTDLGFDVEQIRSVLQSIRDGAMSGDWHEILAYTIWPLAVYRNAAVHHIRGMAQFISQFGHVVPMYLRIVIATQPIATMLINAQGLMYGDGEIWVGVQCSDAACVQKRVGITTLNLK
jgi:hypothetical protein